MDPRPAARAWLLRDLRRVEWRRLLLAVALLAAWARILAPLPAQAGAGAGAGAGDPLLCVAGEGQPGADGGVAPPAHADRACPLCRLADVPVGLVPPVPCVRLAVLDPIAGPTMPAVAPPIPASPPRPPARGPPAIETTR